MGQCATNIRDFHDEEVNLSVAARKEIRTKAETNQRRIDSGLQSQKDPKPRGFWTQGSYAMRTMIQRPANDYDIDAGCYFKAADIADIGPRALRRKVCSAADDGRFNTSPQVKKNCVRIVYNEGYHIDVPVYKLEEDEDGNMKSVLSSADEWRESDPQGVTDWFERERKRFGSAKLRDLVRLLKAFSPKSPSGLVISVLASELVISDGQEDDMLHAAMKDLKAKLDLLPAIHHPVVLGEILEPSNSEVVAKLRNRLGNALKELEGRGNSRKSAELKAWKKVFGNHSFFDKAIKEEEEKEARQNGSGHSGGSGAAIAGIGGGAGSGAIADPRPVQAPRPYAGEDD